MPKYSFKRQDRRINFAEVSQLVDNMHTLELKAIIAALYLTGARISEVLQLKTNNIIKKDKDVTIILVSLKRRGNSSSKPTRSLTFEEDAKLMNYLLDYKDFMERKRIKRMFKLSRQMVWYHIRQHTDVISPHCFRHSRLQQLADAGAGSHRLRSFAGHAKLETSTTYVESSSALLEPLKKLID